MTTPAPSQTREPSRNNGKPKEPVRISFYEKGSSGLKLWSGFVTEAYNAALYFPTVIPLYARLRQSMPEIVMIRRAFSAWSRDVRPVVNLPDDPSDDDKKYQEYLESEFENWDGGFTSWLETCVNYVPFFGWGWWDVQPAIRDPYWKAPNGDAWESEEDDGLIGLRRIAWRDNSTFDGWETVPESKRVIGMWQHDFPRQRELLQLDQSFHVTFGGSQNPEGSSPLEAVWRLERIKYGLEVIQGMGFEHSAGHFMVKKTEKGDIGATDLQNVAEAAKAILSAQEGNYALMPFGLDGSVNDIGFQAAGSLLDAIKYYGITVLSLYTMQWIALNTMTQTGAMASQVDSTNSGVYTYNAMLDGFASQFDDQIGKRLWKWNIRDAGRFPKTTKRPRITFSHIENTIDLGALGSFLGQIYDKMPIGLEDYEAIRQRTGWMPEKTPEDALEEYEAKKEASQKARENLNNANSAGQNPFAPKNEQGTNVNPDGSQTNEQPNAKQDAKAPASPDRSQAVEQALMAYSRSRRS